MQNLTLKVPDNKMAFFLELINSLGFVKIENTTILTTEKKNLIEAERNKIKENPNYLMNWDDARKSLNLD